MAIIQLRRLNERTNRLRRIKIFLDGREVSFISNGEIEDFQITEGPHNVQAKIDWCSSNNLHFIISENESKAFDLTSFAQHSSLGSLAAIYYITFGANRYLNIKETTI